MPQPGFSLFVEQIFNLYDGALRETDMQRVIGRCSSVISQLNHYKPSDDDEEINIETAIELFEDLLARAKLRLKLSR